MKTILALSLTLSTALSLAACGASGDYSSVSDSSNGDHSLSSIGGSASHPASSSSLSTTDDALLYETYTDVSALSALRTDIDDVCVFDDRTLILEDLIDTEPELLTYNLFFYIASAQFDLLMELVGEEESIHIVMGNEGVHFEEGRYCTQTTIHRLDTLTAEDLYTVSDFEKESILTLIHTFSFEEYVVVEAEQSWKYNEAYLSMGPQLADGQRYTRYYLFAKTVKVPEFKLYGIYWEDFLAE